MASVCKDESVQCNVKALVTVLFTWMVLEGPAWNDRRGKGAGRKRRVQVIQQQIRD